MKKIGRIKLFLDENSCFNTCHVCYNNLIREEKKFINKENDL